MSDADLLPPPPPPPSSSASFDAVGTTGSVNGPKENVAPKSSPTLPPSGDSQPAAAPAPVDPDHADSERDGGSIKADSEAETIIQSGRESISPEKRRKHIQHALPATARIGQAHQADSDALDGDLSPPSKKRKRLDHDEPGDGQAALSAIKARSRTSSISSVVKQEDGGKVDENRSKDHQDSIRSLSDAPRRRDAGSRSPKLSLSENSLEGELTGDDSLDHQKQRRRRDSSNDRDRREKSHPQTNTSTSTMKHRSVSPSYYSRKRASSGPQQASSESTQHKRKTAARSTRSPRRQSSEDHHSDSSSASVSPVRSARSQRLTSEGARVSSAKPATHKKQRDQNGRTRLARACAAQEYEAAMARHAERPEDLNVPDNAGNTPLQIASLEGCAPIVKFLLDAGCEIDTKNIDKDTPLIDAVENGHLEVVKLLLDAGANPRLGNAEGDEPYDLVPSDTEDYDEIRKIISHAKAHPARKRRSEDHGFSNSNKGSVPRGTSGTSPRDSPPAHMMSPPPGSSTFSRRKTVRSEATRNDLLWTKATPENLCNFAAKGDMAGVANILNVIQKADTESLIAAAKGGHEDVMSLLLGMGDGDADPEPVENSNCRPGFNTPMLAAIGRGNLAIIRLLLEYPGFNPARRLYKGLTYHEIAEERKGDRWEEEVELLKRAYDKHREMKKAKKAEAKSPKRVREQEKNLKKRARRSASPSSVPRKPASSPASARTADVTSKENSKRRDSTTHKKDSSIASQRHNAVTQDDALSEHSVDQDTTKPKKMSSERRQSDASLHSRGDDAPKRRRLIAGRPPDRDRRRLSLMSTDSVSPREELSKSHSRVLKDLKDTKDALDVPAKLKRPRNSVSPERSRSRGSDRGRDSEDMSQKKKRRLQQEESARKMANGSLKRNDDASSAEANKAASKVDKDAISEKRAARTNEVMAPVKQELKQYDTHQLDRIPLENENTNKESEIAKNAALAQQEEVNSRKRQEEEEARKIAEKEEKEREAREQEEAAAAAARKAEDEARAARELAEEEERKRKELEQRRARQQEEERQRRAEHERLRIAKLRKELEEQEQRRRDALPNRLRVSANLVGANDPRAKSHTWLKQFMPVVTARTAQLDSSCGPEVANELWVPNFLVAPLLATNDLQLSQYASWEKRQATSTQRLNLWRVTRRILVQGDDLETPCSSFGEVIRRDGETRPKYFGMEHIFWVKLSDFMDLVPHIPHLNGLDLEFLKMHIDQEPSSHGDSSEFPDGPQVNGNGYYTTSDHHEITATVNGLTNGFGRPSTYV